jgi:hypothetical protein
MLKMLAKSKQLSSLGLKGIFLSVGNNTLILLVV